MSNKRPNDPMMERGIATLRLPPSTLVRNILTGLATQGYQNRLRELLELIDREDNLEGKLIATCKIKTNERKVANKSKFQCCIFC